MSKVRLSTLGKMLFAVIVIFLVTHIGSIFEKNISNVFDIKPVHNLGQLVMLLLVALVSAVIFLANIKKAKKIKKLANSANSKDSFLKFAAQLLELRTWLTPAYFLMGAIFYQEHLFIEGILAQEPTKFWPLFVIAVATPAFLIFSMWRFEKGLSGIAWKDKENV